MAWRVARSLLTLRDQIDRLYPGRSRASDGTIGDAAHQAVASDHNPDRWGIVRALDITHDPAHGCDIDRLTDALAAGRDDRVSYVIANRLIMSGPGGPAPWVWRTYAGDDPHTNHLHLSVIADSRADSTTPWALPGLTAAPAGGGTDMVLGPDPYDTTISQDAELRNTYFILAQGYWSGETNDSGVIARLNRIEKAVGKPTASVALTPADREAIIRDVSTQVLDGVEARLRAVLGSLDGK